VARALARAHTAGVPSAASRVLAFRSWRRSIGLKADTGVMDLYGQFGEGSRPRRRAARLQMAAVGHRGRSRSTTSADLYDSLLPPYPQYTQVICISNPCYPTPD
jgi:hypothetical protein